MPVQHVDWRSPRRDCTSVYQKIYALFRLIKYQQDFALTKVDQETRIMNLYCATKEVKLAQHRRGKCLCCRFNLARHKWVSTHLAFVIAAMFFRANYSQFQASGALEKATIKRYNK